MSKIEHPEEEARVKVRWPISYGRDIRFAHASAVTRTPHGYVVEFGSCIMTGLMSQADVERAAEGAEFNVVASVLMSVEDTKTFHEFLTKRLVLDGHLKPSAAPESGP